MKCWAPRQRQVSQSRSVWHFRSVHSLALGRGTFSTILCSHREWQYHSRSIYCSPRCIASYAVRHMYFTQVLLLPGCMHVQYSSPSSNSCSVLVLGCCRGKHDLTLSGNELHFANAKSSAKIAISDLEAVAVRQLARPNCRSTLASGISCS